MPKASAFGRRGHIPLHTHPLWPAKLTMRGFTVEYYYEHPPYENPGYAPGMFPTHFKKS